MKLMRRTLIGGGFVAALSALFPEFARAESNTGGAGSDQLAWFWQGTNSVLMDDSTLLAYADLYVNDVARTEAILGGASEEYGPIGAISDLGSNKLLAFAVPMANSNLYFRHIEVSPDGTELRTASTVFEVDEAAETARFSETAPDGQTLASRSLSRAPGQCPNPLVKCSCTGSSSSCRTCREFDRASAGLCCAGCAFSGSAWQLFLACAVLLCSACLANNCTGGYVYACCN